MKPFNFLRKLKGKSKIAPPNVYTPHDIARYYDDWTERYLEVSEEIIQAYRPQSTEELLNYYLKTINIKDGDTVLDAGCGTGGPALFFASQVKATLCGLTISEKQVQIMKAKASETAFTGNIEVQLGDYHHLDKYYQKNTFDHVIFLESLGHSASFEQVLSSAKKVLKPGGKVFIKDFFICETDRPGKKKDIQKVIENINKNYIYNTLELNPLVSWFRTNDFHLDFLQSPKFENDPYIRAEFESRNNINLFEGLKEFMPADWYEMQWTKR